VKRGFAVRCDPNVDNEREWFFSHIFFYHFRAGSRSNAQPFTFSFFFV
jgi:hypothetical protein